MVIRDTGTTGAFAEMIVAVDSSVLISIFNDESSRPAWFEFLLGARVEHRLIACDVVWSEVGSLFATATVFDQSMSKLGVAFSSLDEKAAFAAGQLFLAYRKRGGTRSRIIADFMIAAHARHHADALATADLDFAKQYLPQLQIIGP